MIQNDRFEKSELEELYVSKKLTMQEIGDQFGITRGAIKYWLDKFNIISPYANSGKRHSVHGRLQDLPISDNAKSVITGGLLGDGSLERNHSRYLYTYAHAIKQKEYALWKFSLLGKLTSSNPYEYRESTFDKPCIKIRTISHDSFIDLRKAWYPEGKKIVNYENIKELDELAFFVWYCDDGSKAGRVRYCIATCCFSDEENQILIDILNEKFGIIATMGKKYSKSTDKHYNHLYIDSKNFNKCKDIFLKYVEEIPCMSYKVL